MYNPPTNSSHACDVSAQCAQLQIDILHTQDITPNQRQLVILRYIVCVLVNYEFEFCSRLDICIIPSQTCMRPLPRNCQLTMQLCTTITCVRCTSVMRTWCSRSFQALPIHATCGARSDHWLYTAHIGCTKSVSCDIVS